MLTVLPEPGHGLTRTLPRLWGREAFPDHLRPPAHGPRLFERARLALRAHFAGGELDLATRTLLNPDEPECRRIMDAVNDANVEVYQAFSYVAEWLYQDDIQLGWLRCLDAMLARDATLREGLAEAGWSVSEGDKPVVDSKAKAKAVILTALPEPDHGLERTLPLMWGTKAYPRRRYEAGRPGIATRPPCLRAAQDGGTALARPAGLSCGPG